MPDITMEDISEWFDEGTKMGATHLIIVCDTFDYEDYPVFVGPDENARERFVRYNGPNMQRVMEVYDLRQDKEKQLNEFRSYNFGDEPKSSKDFSKSDSAQALQVEMNRRSQIQPEEIQLEEIQLEIEKPKQSGFGRKVKL